MKKKITIAMLAAVLAVSAAACGNGSPKDGGKASADSGSAADKIKYEVADCVTLGDYSALQLSMPDTYEVTKEQIEDYALENAEKNADPVYKDTDKTTVEEGDTVNIDYEGKKDGVAFEGGTAAGHNLTIGSGDFIDGFEDGLIGKKVGETVDINLICPDNYPPELAGAAVVFTVKVNKIVEEDEDVEFVLNDEFVQQKFECQTVKEYKKKVKEYLESLNKSRKEVDTRQAVVNKLQEVCQVTVPEGLIDARVSDYTIQFTNNNCTDGTSLADYLSKYYNGMTEEDFHSSVTTEIEANLNTELILEAIVEKEGMELDEDSFQEYVKKQMEAYSYKTEEDFYKANGVDAASGEAYERKIFVCNRALDMVIENAKIEYGVEPEEGEAE